MVKQSRYIEKAVQEGRGEGLYVDAERDPKSDCVSVRGTAKKKECGWAVTVNVILKRPTRATVNHGGREDPACLTVNPMPYGHQGFTATLNQACTSPTGRYVDQPWPWCT